MNIKERIEKLSIYFDSMNIASENNIIYIRVKFPKGWDCSELTEYNFNVKSVKDEVPGYFYFFADLEIGFDKVFDAIDYNIKFNEEAQIKVNLLREKVEELKNIFEKEDIETLKTLEFLYKKKKNKQSKKNKNKSEIIEDEFNDKYQTQINSEIYKNNEEEITVTN